MNILVVEDNLEINKIITKMLQSEGYNVTSCTNAFDALKSFSKNDYFCVITDLMMPIMSGEELIEKLRPNYLGLIIAVTAKTGIDDKLYTLSIGADDYIIKPFNRNEILFKIKNYYNKFIQTRKNISFNNGELIFNFNDNQLIVCNNIVELTAIEFLIVKFFIQNVNQVLSRDQIMKNVYYEDFNVFDRAIDGHIKNIRKKIADFVSKKYIHTVYGLGYKFVGEIDA